MIPSGISQKNFIYNPISPNQLVTFYNEFMKMLEDFSLTITQGGELVVNKPIIARICLRIDQRKDYYMYYHSTSTKIMLMSQEKELALWAYWVSKYKPIRFEKIEDEALFFSTTGCTVSDAFASYIVISTVCANDQNKVSYFTGKVVADLNYDFTNRDFSKEAIIARINDLLA